MSDVRPLVPSWRAQSVTWASRSTSDFRHAQGEQSPVDGLTPRIGFQMSKHPHNGPSKTRPWCRRAWFAFDVHFRQFGSVAVVPTGQ